MFSSLISLETKLFADFKYFKELLWDMMMKDVENAYEQIMGLNASREKMEKIRSVRAEILCR